MAWLLVLGVFFNPLILTSWRDTYGQCVPEKRIYLGEGRQISQLFWLLASPVGRARTFGEVQRAVDDMETPRDID